MNKRNMYTGFLLGAAMLASVSGTAMAATQQTQPQKAVTQETKKETGTTKTTADKKQDQKMEDQKDKEKKETSLYGTIFKIDKEKMELKTAAVVWEKDTQTTDTKMNDQKTPATEAKDVKATEKADQNEVKADFETDVMKWKLDGKTVVVKLDKDTRFLKQISRNANQVTPNNKADVKTDQKTADKKAESKDNAIAMECETMKQEDLKEGVIVRIKEKEDGSLVAAEVMVLADVKENKAADAKEAPSKSDATKGTEKKDTENKTTNAADTAKG